MGETPKVSDRFILESTKDMMELYHALEEKGVVGLVDYKGTFINFGDVSFAEAESKVKIYYKSTLRMNDRALFVLRKYLTVSELGYLVILMSAICSRTMQVNWFPIEELMESVPFYAFRKKLRELGVVARIETNLHSVWIFNPYIMIKTYKVDREVARFFKRDLFERYRAIRSKMWAECRRRTYDLREDMSAESAALEEDLRDFMAKNGSWIQPKETKAEIARAIKDSGKKALKKKEDASLRRAKKKKEKLTP